MGLLYIHSNLSTPVSHRDSQKWPLLTSGLKLCSEHQKLLIGFSQDTLRLAFVDRKPLLAGVVMHRFDYISCFYYKYTLYMFTCLKEQLANLHTQLCKHTQPTSYQSIYIIENSSKCKLFTG